MQNKLEIACFNIRSAIIAEAAGADRIELCSDYPSGGITPSKGLILECRSIIKIPVHVIIRIRGGDFIYSDLEIEEMKNDILFCKKNKINGVVFGVLTKDSEIDIQICRELVQLAKPMSVTFHRAIDSCKNLTKTFLALIDLNINRVLTSGGKTNAMDGMESLKTLQKQFGQKILIIPAGNIRSTNILEIKTTGCLEFHSSALVSTDFTANETEVKKLKSALNTGINL